MGIIRIFSGEKPLSPAEKRVRRERTGYGSDLDKVVKRTLKKLRKKRVFDPRREPHFASFKIPLRRGDVVINTRQSVVGKDFQGYKVFVISSDGTSQGENAEVGVVRKLNPKAKRISLALPLTKDHDPSELIGLYPFEDPLLV